MGEVAGELLLAQPTLTRVVDGLVDRALVYRRASDADRRKVAVHLSRQGRTRLARLDAVAAAHETALATTPGGGSCRQGCRPLPPSRADQGSGSTSSWSPTAADSVERCSWPSPNRWSSAVRWLV